MLSNAFIMSAVRFLQSLLEGNGIVASSKDKNKVNIKKIQFSKPENAAMKRYFNSNMSEDLGLGDTNKIDSQTTEIVELQFVAGSEGMGVFFGCRFFNFIFIVLWILFGCLYQS